MSASMPRVAFVTNLAPPYRRPVWEHLTRRTDLTVVLLQRDDAAITSANRTLDWLWAGSSSSFRVDFVRTAHITTSRERYYLGLAGLLRLVRGTDCLVLGGWESPVYWQLRVLAWVLRKPAVGFYESTSRSHSRTTGPIPRARGFFFRSLSAVVCPGVASRRTLEAMGVRPSAIFEGFNAVDVRAVHEGAVAARRAGTSPEAGAFVYIGQLIQRKNITLMLDAFDALPGPATLTVAGAGELLDTVLARAGHQHDGHELHYVGTVLNEDVPALLAGSATLLLLSGEEVWGLVVNEALAAGLQVIVSSTCGVAESVAGMQGVWVVEPTLEAVVAAMTAARGQWQGPVSEPAILTATPEAFADVFAEAVASATGEGVPR